MKKTPLFRRLVASWCIFAFTLIPPAALAGFEPGKQYAIRHLDTPCAYYLLGPDDREKAVRITEGRTQEELAVSLADLKKNPLRFIENLGIEDLQGVVVGSVGAPLNGSAMKEEAAKVRQQLAAHDLDRISVKVFPRPMTFIQQVRAEFPVAAMDYVPPENAEQEAEAQRRGLQITASANITTYTVLLFMGPATGGAAWLLAVPPTVGNLVIDYYIGKNRNSVNNFLARAGNSRLSALFRDTQLSLLFAVPFYLLPRITDFLVENATGSTSLYERFISMELGTAALAIGGGVTEILASSVLQALQIFTFMNPNAVVDQLLVNDGTTMTETELSRRNGWRVAGFFAITAPIFAAANNPAAAVAFSVPFLDIPVSYPHLAMAAIATANYFIYYKHPRRLVQFPTNAYQGLGWAMAEVVSEWLVVKPLNLMGSAWRALRGR